MIGVCVAEGAAHQPGTLLTRARQSVETEVDAIDLLLEAAAARSLYAVLLAEGLDPGARLSAVAHFTQALAEVFEVGHVGERLRS